MAVFCTKCGAQMDENDSFCKACGAPAVKPAGKGSDGGQDAQKHKMLGMAVVAVAALAVVIFAVKGISGMFKGGEKAPEDGDAPVTEVKAGTEDDDTLKHLEPWMGDWGNSSKVRPDLPLAVNSNLTDEGNYHGYIMEWSNGAGDVHVDEDYIDFSDITKNDKDCFPVSELKYYRTSYGADAFEDEDSGIRFVFFEHCYTGSSEDYGKVLKVQAYVGNEIPELNYIGDVPVGFTGHYPGSDGWALDTSTAFLLWD